MRKFFSIFSEFLNIHAKLDEIKVNQGIIISKLNRGLSFDNLPESEFKVFSQWGEDGIIQYLINNVELKDKTFIEFGVEDFFESNCRFLLTKDNWRGFVIDGSSINIERLKSSYFYWKYDLTSASYFITRDNINNILAESGFDHDLGILSVDLDGNDYYVLEAIKDYSPRILICEFNANFGGARKISVPYDESFSRMDAHFSGLYWGASLAAVNYIASRKGLSLVGINSAGNNAFFVRDDLIKNPLKSVSVAEAFATSTYREGRNESGRLNFYNSRQREDMLRGLPVFEVQKEEIEKF